MPQEFSSSRPTPHEVTELLDDWKHGDAEALDRLIPLVYEDLRRIARGQLYGEGGGHTLEPTALVNEVYLKLYQRRSVRFKSREHFLATLAQMMRRILVDHARRRLAAKRGSGARKVSLEDLHHLPDLDPHHWVALDEALKELAGFDERKSHVVNLRFFIGLTTEEAAKVLGVSVNTVDRDWHRAKLWLRRALNGQGIPEEAGRS